jgi:DNA-binding transcriptional ArsR family regulator
VDSDSKNPSVENEKITLLRKIVQDATRSEILRCLSDGMWHTTSELARYARKTNPVMGLVTVGTILGRMQEQLGEHFLEQMVQKAEEGITSWRIGVDWLDIVNEILKNDETSSSSSLFNV